MRTQRKAPKPQDWTSPWAEGRERRKKKAGLSKLLSLLRETYTWGVSWVAVRGNGPPHPLAGPEWEWRGQGTETGTEMSIRQVWGVTVHAGAGQDKRLLQEPAQSKRQGRTLACIRNYDQTVPKGGLGRATCTLEWVQLVGQSPPR